MDEPELRVISAKQYLTISGEGAPDAPAVAAALARVNKALKISAGLLNALWWSEGAGDEPSDKPDDWRWTIMTEALTIKPAQLEEAVAAAKAEEADPLLDKVTLETYEEGQVVQVLYTGDLADKQPAIEKMMAFALRQGFSPTGKYHEIYLDAPGSVAPDISRTILRQPLAPSQS